MSNVCGLKCTSTRCYVLPQGDAHTFNLFIRSAPCIQCRHYLWLLARTGKTTVTRHLTETFLNRHKRLLYTAIAVKMAKDMSGNHHTCCQKVTTVIEGLVQCSAECRMCVSIESPSLWVGRTSNTTDRMVCCL